MCETRISSLLGRITILFVICCCCFPAQAKYGGGNGEPNAPYLIYDPNHMQAIGADANDWDKHFLLCADIDLSDFTGTSFNIIGTGYNPFTGVFDGNGHIISNFSYHATDRKYYNFIGIFGGVGGRDAEIKNLGLVATIIDADKMSYVGSLVGRLGMRGAITECYSEATSVSSSSPSHHVGGLCGYNQGTISDCYVTGTVTGYGEFGGLCGRNAAGSIEKCSATVSVIGDIRSSRVGGLCGYNYGTISECYATATVTGGSCVGGLCGFNNTGTILDSYACGSVMAEYYFGGLCGENDSMISNCYATTSVFGGDSSRDFGGLCGENKYSSCILNCFWDQDMCGVGYSSGGWAFSSAEMMTESTYIGWNNGAWVIDEGRDYPHLAWEGTPGKIIVYQYPRTYPGDGEDQPFELDSAEDLVCMSLRPTDWDKDFVLTGDIDMAQITDYRPPGLFTGTLNGQGHVIRNLTIDVNSVGSNALLGLFGVIDSPGRVIALGMHNMGLYGGNAASLLGVICGSNRGSIAECYATGCVSGADGSEYLGGLCGYNHYAPSTISDCYVTTTVTTGNGSSSIGGLCGYNNWGAISACYAAGRVTAGDHSYWLGGLCGHNAGSVSNCYWDKDTAGTIHSAGGWAFSTAKMMTESTYVGWKNGAWVIDEGRDYPRLAWEGTPGKIIEYEYPRTYPGDGEDQPFELDSAEDLVCMSLRPADWDKDFVLTGHIDMAEIVDYRPPGLFTGVLNGQRHVIQNLTVDVNSVGSNSLLGLIGFVDSPGRVVAVGVSNTSIISGDGSSLLGCLCGMNSAHITNCFSTGRVMGGERSYELGGLCGRNYEGTIDKCYASASVTGTNFSWYFGGLCGYSLFGTISDCYAAGGVEGGRVCYYLGGLCGYQLSGIISRTYSVGRVTESDYSHDLGGLCGRSSGKIADSFWDIETSGQERSDGGVGLTTAQMQMASTFLEAGWDFMNETENGTEDIWMMTCEGMSYPKLSWWQPVLGDFLCPDGVDMIDLEHLALHWLDTGCDETNDYCDWAEISNDSTINFTDFAILAGSWLAGR